MNLPTFDSHKFKNKYTKQIELTFQFLIYINIKNIENVTHAIIYFLNNRK